MLRPNYDFNYEEVMSICYKVYENLKDCYDITPTMIYKMIDGEYHDNGYEYAKRLEELGFYDIDSQLVEELDWIINLFDRLNEEKIIKWCKENNIKPKFKVNDEVYFMNKFEKQKSIIKKIDYKTCVYHIKLNENSCRLIPFEKIEELNK